MSDRSRERWAYDDEGDILDVYFDDFAGERPVWTLELTDNITISIERATRRALALGFLDFKRLVRRTPFGPRSFPVTGLADLPLAERDLVLEVLGREPVRHWLDVSTVEQLPDSPFAVTHLEPLPSELARLVA
ncbi:MAG TPA: hypothetical protein VGG06_08275 [Thermoanaerobaculia bacterium]|jgi:hypothetical protein